MLKQYRLAVCATCVAAWLGFGTPAFAQADEPTFGMCLDALGERARNEGVDGTVVAAVLENTIRLERVIDLDRSQPEFTRTFADYYDNRVTERRVAQGRVLYAEHRELLDRLQREYGVPSQYLLAFWGLETNYGRHFGRIPTPSALATLACDRRRPEFFADEFVAAIKIIAAGDIERQRMRGSWAGALGHMQFLPSVFEKYAIDGDGDGRRDLWGSIPDALASAANFLRGIGWQPELRWGREVRLPRDFDYTLAGPGQRRKLKDWVNLGITDAYGGTLPPLDIEAAVLVPAGHLGPAFLVYDNFDVIMRWNRSEYYAISVGRLADRIAGSVALTRETGADNEPVTREEVRLLQEELVALGYDAGEADGIFGPATRRALSLFQNARGMIADGHLDQEALQAVRNAASADRADSSQQL